MQVASVITLPLLKVKKFAEDHYIILESVILVNMMGNLYQVDLIQLSSDRNSEGIPREILQSWGNMDNI